MKREYIILYSLAWYDDLEVKNFYEGIDWKYKGGGVVLTNDSFYPFH